MIKNIWLNVESSAFYPIRFQKELEVLLYTSALYTSVLWGFFIILYVFEYVGSFCVNKVKVSSGFYMLLHVFAKMKIKLSWSAFILWSPFAIQCMEKAALYLMWSGTNVKILNESKVRIHGSKVFSLLAAYRLQEIFCTYTCGILFIAH